MGAIHRDEGLERVIQQALDDGRSVWVVGDIHGHLKTFKALLDILWHPLQKRETDEHDPSEDLVICLGDLIDRGPDSKGVLELVRDTDNIHSIRGNHDEMLR